MTKSIDIYMFIVYNNCQEGGFFIKIIVNNIFLNTVFISVATKWFLTDKLVVLNYSIC